MAGHKEIRGAQIVQASHFSLFRVLVNQNTNQVGRVPYSHSVVEGDGDELGRILDLFVGDFVGFQRIYPYDGVGVGVILPRPGALLDFYYVDVGLGADEQFIQLFNQP